MQRHDEDSREEAEGRIHPGRSENRRRREGSAETRTAQDGRAGPGGLPLFCGSMRTGSVPGKGSLAGRTAAMPVGRETAGMAIRPRAVRTAQTARRP